MSPINDVNQLAALKEQKMREITALLKDQSPMEPAAIIKLIPNLSLHAANRYLDELLTAGYIRKVQSPGKRKNIRAYEYRADYSSKTDMVSVAVSHPLHQMMIGIVKKGAHDN